MATGNLLIVLLLLVFLAPLSLSLTSDGLALLALKSAVDGDPEGSLASWKDSDATPCGWIGVGCSGSGAGVGRVSSLQLPNLSLAGYLPSELSLLSDLQTLSLPSNLFSGPIPSALAEIRSLAYLDLAGNLLSGQIPAGIGDLARLIHLDLSANRLNGTIPAAIASLNQISGVLNLSCNMLSGGIPPAFGAIPGSVSLDLRWNNLSGEIPQVSSLLNQGPTAFAGNPNLCGFPLKTPCSAAPAIEDPGIEIPVSGGATTNPISAHPMRSGQQHRKPAVAVPVLAGVALAAVASVLVLQWHFRRRHPAAKGEDQDDEVKEKEKGFPAAAARRDGRPGGELFVAVDEGFGMELDELLRASAYVVGKSRSGIVYRVVAARGPPVAVRRLSESEEDSPEGDAGAGGEEWRRRRAFEAEAMAIGRAKHPNVVTLRAYYYSPDEKLLIYDFVPNGNLQAALHVTGISNPAAAPPPLSWAARLSIIKGAARGLAFLHECSQRKYVHGSFRTSKILLDDELNPHISGFGLARLVSCAAAGATHKQLSHSASKKLVVSAASGAASPYAAPEARPVAAAGNMPVIVITQKCDVYSFGVVLLEVLTGRSPESAKAAPEKEGEEDEEAPELEVFVRRAFKEEKPLSEVVDPALLHEAHARKQVLAVFHVALGCTDADPEARPRMRAVSESLDRIVGGGGSGGGAR